MIKRFIKSLPGMDGVLRVVEALLNIWGYYKAFLTMLIKEKLKCK
jgi:hypothetical protein